MAQERDGEVEVVKLSQAASYLIEECRMVLPGVQAIFGFQLIAVFNQRFPEDLPDSVQYLHFASLTLVALDYFVVGWLVFESPWVALPAALLMAVLTILWFAFPRMRRPVHERSAAGS